MSKRLPPMHPGEVLREEFLVPLKLSAGALADEPRSLDLRARGAKKAGTVPNQVVDEVLSKVSALFE